MLRQSHVPQHHDRAEEERRWIRLVLAGNIRGCTMYLEGGGTRYGEPLSTLQYNYPGLKLS